MYDFRYHQTIPRTRLELQQHHHRHPSFLRYWHTNPVVQQRPPDAQRLQPSSISAIRVPKTHRPTSSSLDYQLDAGQSEIESIRMNMLVLERDITSIRIYFNDIHEITISTRSFVRSILKTLRSTVITYLTDVQSYHNRVVKCLLI